MEILVSVMIAALLTVAGATVYVGRVVIASRIDPLPAPAEVPATPDWLDDVGELNARVDRLTNAVADGIERVARSENRIQKTVTSARRLVREAGLEHAGIEAEHAQLQPPDDPGVEPLPALPEEMEEARTVRIPGGRLQIG